MRQSVRTGAGVLSPGKYSYGTSMGAAEAHAGSSSWASTRMGPWATAVVKVRGPLAGCGDCVPTGAGAWAWSAVAARAATSAAAAGYRRRDCDSDIGASPEGGALRRRTG
jgi:hypothetical protein